MCEKIFQLRIFELKKFNQFLSIISSILSNIWITLRILRRITIIMIADVVVVVAQIESH